MGEDWNDHDKWGNFAEHAYRENERLRAMNRVTRCYWCTMFFERHGIICDHWYSHTIPNRWGYILWTEGKDVIEARLKAIDETLPQISWTRYGELQGSEVYRIRYGQRRGE